MGRRFDEASVQARLGSNRAEPTCLVRARLRHEVEVKSASSPSEGEQNRHPGIVLGRQFFSRIEIKPHPAFDRAFCEAQVVDDRISERARAEAP